MPKIPDATAFGARPDISPQKWAAPLDNSAIPKAIEGLAGLAGQLQTINKAQQAEYEQEQDQTEFENLTNQANQALLDLNDPVHGYRSPETKGAAAPSIMQTHIPDYEAKLKAISAAARQGSKAQRLFNNHVIPARMFSANRDAQDYIAGEDETVRANNYAGGVTVTKELGAALALSDAPSAKGDLLGAQKKIEDSTRLFYKGKGNGDFIEGKVVGAVQEVHAYVLDALVTAGELGNEIALAKADAYITEHKLDMNEPHLAATRLKLDALQSDINTRDVAAAHLTATSQLNAEAAHPLTALATAVGGSGPASLVSDQLAAATTHQESPTGHYDPQGVPVTSSAGALGGWQVTEDAAQDVAKATNTPYSKELLHHVREAKPGEPLTEMDQKAIKYNAFVGRSYLGMQMAANGGKMPEALAAYNAGPGGLADAVAKEKEFSNPKGLVTPGNINLFNRPDVANADGSHSSVNSMSFEENGVEILVPQVSEDGRMMTGKEAIAQYHATGKHLGIFKTADQATAYAELLHQQQASIGLVKTAPWLPFAPPETRDYVPKVLANAQGVMEKAIQRSTSRAPNLAEVKAGIAADPKLKGDPKLIAKSQALAATEYAANEKAVKDAQDLAKSEVLAMYEASGGARTQEIANREVAMSGEDQAVVRGKAKDILEGKDRVNNDPLYQDLMAHNNKLIGFDLNVHAIEFDKTSRDKLIEKQGKLKSESGTSMAIVEKITDGILEDALGKKKKDIDAGVIGQFASAMYDEVGPNPSLPAARQAANDLVLKYALSRESGFFFRSADTAMGFEIAVPRQGESADVTSARETYFSPSRRRQITEQLTKNGVAPSDEQVWRAHLILDKGVIPPISTEKRAEIKASLAARKQPNDEAAIQRAFVRYDLGLVMK